MKLLLLILVLIRQLIECTDGPSRRIRPSG
jgi:hypothetical protein